MNLVMVAQDFPPSWGGVQTYAYELARRWAERCASFRVIAPQHPEAAAFDAGAAFTIQRVKGAGNLFAAAAAPALAKARGAVTFHTQWPSAAAAIALRQLGVLSEVAVAAHGRELLLAPWSKVSRAQHGYDAVRKRVFQNASRVYAVSRYTAGLVEGLGVSKDRIYVRGNGTDPSRFFPHPVPELRARLALHGAFHDAFVFVTVSRLVPRKGIDRVVKAFAQLAATEANARLVIVGGGPEREALEALTRELDLGERVHFAGKVENDALPDWYALGDAFVLPIESTPPDVEGFGIAYLEASASELPVIGPNVGGPVDAIKDGETGLMIDPKDISAIASAMRRLLGDRALAKQLGQQGRKFVIENATWDHTASMLFDDLTACVDSKGG